eukprot:12371568-Alexandrium_andersonii.AAC.1
MWSRRWTNSRAQGCQRYRLGAGRRCDRRTSERRVQNPVRRARVRACALVFRARSARFRPNHRTAVDAAQSITADLTPSKRHST